MTVFRKAVRLRIEGLTDSNTNDNTGARCGDVRSREEVQLELSNKSEAEVFSDDIVVSLDGEYITNN